jgi:hypothetical protein
MLATKSSGKRVCFTSTLCRCTCASPSFLKQPQDLSQAHGPWHGCHVDNGQIIMTAAVSCVSHLPWMQAAVALPRTPPLHGRDTGAPLPPPPTHKHGLF